VEKGEGRGAWIRVRFAQRGRAVLAVLGDMDVRRARRSWRDGGCIFRSSVAESLDIIALAVENRCDDAIVEIAGAAVMKVLQIRSPICQAQSLGQ
jgi:hypothetical protein